MIPHASRELQVVRLCLEVDGARLACVAARAVLKTERLLKKRHQLFFLCHGDVGKRFAQVDAELVDFRQQAARSDVDVLASPMVVFRVFG